MSAIVTSVALIPNFLKARSPQGLRLAMLNNNKKTGKYFKYSTPMQSNDGLWYTWFDIDITMDDELTKLDPNSLENKVAEADNV